MRSLFAGAFLIAAGTTAFAQDTGRDEKRLERIEEKLSKLTPEHFQETVSRSGDDELDTFVTITTQDGFRHRGGFTDRYRTDSFIRAIISKQTGEASFQIYATISYNHDWRNYTRVNFATPQGPHSAELDVIDKDVNCSTSAGYSICTYDETVGFTVDEHLLREIAGDGTSPWRFRFYSQGGIDWTEIMSRAEISGLLAAVDQYRSDHDFE